MDIKDFQRIDRKISEFFLALFKAALRGVDEVELDNIGNTIDLCVNPKTWDLLNALLKVRDLKMQSMGKTRDGVEISFAFGGSYRDVPNFPYSSVMFRLADDSSAMAPCFFSRISLNYMNDIECILYAELNFHYKMTADEFENIARDTEHHVTMLALRA
jgi:hypothetical protein